MLRNVANPPRNSGKKNENPLALEQSNVTKQSAYKICFLTCDNIRPTLFQFKELSYGSAVEWFKHDEEVYV